MPEVQSCIFVFPFFSYSYSYSISYEVKLLAFAFKPFAFEAFCAILAESFRRQTLNAFIHFSTRLERNTFLGWQHKRFAGVWIATAFGSPITNFKNAKLSQFDPAVSNQAVDDGVQGFLDRFLGQRLGNVQRLGNLFGDFLLRLQNATNNLAYG